MGLSAKPRATTSSPVLFLPRWVHGVHRVTDVFLTGDATQMIPHPTFTENGTDPTSFTSVRNEADRVAAAGV
jgi:hypothetical protein